MRGVQHTTNWLLVERAYQKIRLLQLSHSSLQKRKVRKEALERLFVEFLGRLNPRPEYLQLFGAIVLDVWKEKHAEGALQIAALKDRLKKLEWHKQQLIDAFLYRADIDKGLFDDQMSKLKEEVTLAEMDLQQWRLEELDVEAVLNFSQYVLLNASRLWMETSLDQKQRVQKILYPEGLEFLRREVSNRQDVLSF